MMRSTTRKAIPNARRSFVPLAIYHTYRGSPLAMIYVLPGIITSVDCFSRVTGKKSRQPDCRYALAWWLSPHAEVEGGETLDTNITTTIALFGRLNSLAKVHLLPHAVYIILEHLMRTRDRNNTLSDN